MASRLALAAILLVVGLAGCNSSPPAPPEETTSQSMTATTTASTDTSSSTAPPLPPLAFQLVLNDCKGIRSLYTFPGDTAPAGDEVPPGWEQEAPASTDQSVIIVECGRLSLGPFERGPIRMLIESHTKANAPPKCLDYEPAVGEADVLRGIWFDDPEVAAYLAQEWNMAVHVGSFEYEETTQGGVSVRKWTWSEAGGPVSELDYSRTETAEGGNPSQQRFFWHSGGAALMLDLVMDDKQPLVTPYTTAGWFRAPMMQAEAGVELYAGVSSLVDPGAAYTGTFHRFRDLQCSEP